MLPDRDLRAVADQVFGFHGRGEYEQALEVVRRAAPRFPDRAETITYWAACLESRLGHAERALQTLEAGLARGLWWPAEMLRWDEDFAPIRERAAFAAIIAACDDRLRAAQATATVQLHVEHPARANSRAPLVLALHWRGRPVDDFEPWWRPAVRYGAVLALLRSSQPLGMRSFGWDDPVRSRQDVAAAWGLLRGGETFDPAKVVLAGASQGAALAIDLALREALLPVRGVIAVVPALSDLPGLAPAIAMAAQRGLCVWLVTGEHDDVRTSVETLAAELSQADVPCHLDIAPGVGHDFPPNFETTLPAALDFVLSDKARSARQEGSDG
jgi:predicted esterase